MRQIFFAAAMLLIAFTASSQHFIKGKVTDQNGNALMGATITTSNGTQKQTGQCQSATLVGAE